MPISKARISSPLEAGSSLLDAQLPEPVTSALEYVSRRLARKGLHLSLIVRKEMDISFSSISRTASPSSSVASSPAQSVFSAASPASSTFSRTLSHHSSNSSFTDASSIHSASSKSRTQWASLPSSPKDFAASPRSHFASGASSPTLSCSTPTSPNPYGITLMHANTLTEKAEKVLRHTIAKAEKKFSIGSGWLSPTPLTDSPLTQDLIARSLAQNEILFSSEGITLLSLDRIYTFKCALNTYSRTLSSLDLASAIDELRRLVLAQNGKRITKAYLVRSYEWLSISIAALIEVNEGYKTAYGGPQRYGGIEVPAAPSRPSPPLLKTSFASSELKKMKLSISYSPISNATTLCDTGSPIREVEVGESAKGTDNRASFWGSDGLREDRGPHRRGPMTPNGFEDITPVTKGEWCFLMVGEGWKGGRSAAVETC
ncbi:hypothetical protein LSUE1_G007394 [Lachnellula suecica]|uniref:DUF7582 domain-containing protein n=1 Tax=Lachnellula suecica TaxID=602035 RepID=A0A8T9C6J8_9HELO|nr:hypothetical protein LSUE1_G007394 [Lachnellula suecica]